MKRRLSFILFTTGVAMSSLIFYHLVHESFGQTSISPNQTELVVQLTVLGVDNKTGFLLLFFNAGDLTTTRYFNASEYDGDRDGIVDYAERGGIVDRGLSFPNATVKTGANFTACNVIVKEASMSCESGVIIEGRKLNVQFVLPSFKRAANTSNS